jgi:hypothetical protein
LLLTFLGYAQEQTKCGLLYYGDKAMTVKAPEGWVLDCEAGLVSHIPMVLYKEGSTWQDAETVMYVNFASLEMPDQETLKALMAYDEEQFKSYKGIEIAQQETLKIGNYNGVIKYFGGGDYPNYEYLAYLDVDTFAIMMVISSRSKEDLKASYSKFTEVLNSIRILKIETDRKK